MKATTPQEHLIPSREVMARLGYNNRASFLEFIKREGLPFYRLGARRIMFDPAEVESWLARHKVGRGAAQ